MADNRLVRLTACSSELQATLKPEGGSPLEPQKVVDAIGADVLEQLRLIGVSAQNGDPLAYGRAMAIDLEERRLAGIILGLFVAAVNGGVRFFDTDPELLTVIKKDTHERLIYETVAAGFLILMGFTHEACQLERSELTATIQFLATQGELREYLFAALVDGERFFIDAMERNILPEYSHPEDMQAEKIVAQIKEKLSANAALQESS